MRITSLAFLFSAALSSASYAQDTLPWHASPDTRFNQSAGVADAELATLRGGFMNVRGMMIDFSFLSRIQMENRAHQLSTAREIAFTTKDLVSAQSQRQAQQTQQDNASIQNEIIDQASQQPGATQPASQAFQPIVIQNSLSGTTISMQQVMDIAVSGGALQGALMTRMHGIDIQAISALRGL